MNDQFREHKDHYGHLYMGPYRVHGPNWPVYPQWIVMTDREDGEQYALAHTGDEGSLTLDLTTTLPLSHKLYGAYEGPYLYPYRLYITGGVLSIERAPDRVYNQRVLARRGNLTYYLEITAPAGVITYTEVDLHDG